MILDSGDTLDGSFFISPKTSLMRNRGSSIFFTVDTCIHTIHKEKLGMFWKRRKECIQMYC